MNSKLDLKTGLRRTPAATDLSRASPRRGDGRSPEHYDSGSIAPDAAVKQMVRQAKARGYLTHAEVDARLVASELTSEQMEDVLAMLHDMGIHTIAAEDAESDADEKKPDEEGEMDGVRVEPVVKPVAIAAKAEAGERTDDAVRVYLREIGSRELLSREGEIAIAKRIEAGREAIIAALCESPLTFQAMIVWRDELNAGRTLLRDIIDLEETYAGPDAKGWNSLAPVPGEADEPPAAGQAVDAAIPATAASHGTTSGSSAGGLTGETATAADTDRGEDDGEDVVPLAAIEAALKPKVFATLEDRRHL
jgi:RNA polymerase primary sigma factor